MTQPQVEGLAGDLLANRLIERIAVAPAAAYAASPPDVALPVADVEREPVAEVVALPESDEALLALSRSRTLALSVAEMRAIREHYLRPEVRARRTTLGLPSEPTDVELEAIAQTWSEHCKHKIFAATIRWAVLCDFWRRIAPRRAARLAFFFASCF